MTTLEEALERLEALLGEVEDLDEPVRAKVFELLDGVDALHRMALERLADLLDASALERFREADAAVAWLFDAYGAGIDQRVEVERALEEIRPYIHSHGGIVQVLGVESGVVRLKMAGACSGCTASAITLREGIERALRDHFPAFAGLEVEEDEGADAHPPPGPTLLQIQPLRK